MSGRGPLLLVEDNELNRDMLRRRLTRAGFAVLTAGDGREALERMETQEYSRLQNRRKRLERSEMTVLLQSQLT